jgi:hypothetical protein
MAERDTRRDESAVYTFGQDEGRAPSLEALSKEPPDDFYATEAGKNEVGLEQNLNVRSLDLYLVGLHAG